jgi:predicted ATPase/DNA-binding CsgD family transcriptional regulator
MEKEWYPMTQPESSHNQSVELADPLTDREIEILRLIADGWTDRKIGQHLALAVDTVKWYNRRIYSKLFVKNRTQAVKWARESGLLTGASTQLQPTETVTPRHNLPAATTPFVGRELELAELTDLLAHETIRLVTILAAGGMGKTRLALEAAKSQLPSFRHGVYFISLVPLRAVDHIIPTIAAQLNVQLSASADPTAHLLNYLRDKVMFLVLDNFEHLLEGASLITMLLEAAPRLKIVVTSRERLNLHGETVYALGGMALPSGETRSEALTCSSVQLFIQRVQLMRPTATVPDAELGYVSRICRQVGGMPLGIELAASLVDVLSPQEIFTEIEQSFDILATEMRDVPRRLRSIRAIFDYSWSHLTAADREVYMRLAIFRGGFTRDAAQAVTGANVRVLKRLVNKSLVQREADSERFVIHELLRQYAEEQLTAAGAAEATHQAHTTYYTNFMAQAERGLKGQGQLDALNQIEADFENIRAAWQWAVDQTDFAAIDQMLEALYWFCNMRARVPFGLSFASEAHPVQRRLLLRFDAAGDAYKTQIDQTLRLVGQDDNQREAAFFLWMLGVNRYVSGDFDQAIIVLKEALDLCQRLGDDFYACEALHLLGMCARFAGQIEAARSYERESRKLSRRTANKFALGRALGSQGLIAILEDNTPQAKNDLQEAIKLRSEVGDLSGVAMSLTSLGQAAFFRGDFLNARRHAEESLELATNINSQSPQVLALGVLSWLASLEEAYSQAWDLAQQGLAIAPDPNTFVAQLGLVMAACGLANYAAVETHLQTLVSSGSPWHSTIGGLSCLPVLAILYANQGETERAVEVLALAFTHPSSSTQWMEKWMLLERWRARLETDLGPERYEAAWERGTKLELETVIRDVHAS